MLFFWYIIVAFGSLNPIFCNIILCSIYHKISKLLKLIFICDIPKIQKNPNIFFLCCPISKVKSFYGIDMFDPIISRFTDKTYIHKMGKNGIKVESSFYPTK